MLTLRVLECISALAAVAGAVPATTGSRATEHVVHEERGAAMRSDWVRRERVDASTVLPVRIGLAQSKLETGHDLLMDVTDPKSPRYGQWWRAQDVHAHFSPSDEAVAAVRGWLAASGIADHRVVHSDNRGWLAFDATAREAEDLLRAEFYEHEHHRAGGVRVGADKYHVPEHLTAHIDYITPGVKLVPVVKKTVQRRAKPDVQKRSGSKSSSRSRSRSLAGNKTPFADRFPIDYMPAAAANLSSAALQACGTNVTPACYKALYQLPTPRAAVPGHSLGLYEQGDWFAKADVDSFFADFAPYVPQGTYPVPALIDGARYAFPATNTTRVTGEADIDIDIATSLIYPQTITLYQVDDQIYEPEEVETTNLFNTFLDALDGSYCTYKAYNETGDDPSIDPVYPDPAAGGYKGKLQCGVYTPTKVISASYGQAEADLPAAYMKRQCHEFLKLGLQGHSVLVASGDYGVASFPGDGPEGNANGCLGPDSKIFSPQYPSNCPYVTSVGATLIYPDQTVHDPESVMLVDLGGDEANFSTAGGFSNYYAAPSYQKSALATYFAAPGPVAAAYPSYAEFAPDLAAVDGLYNRLGRGYPDVAANGANLHAYTNGVLEHWYGSSLASPIFASVLTLLNQERARLNKTAVGFVNPVLYAHPEVLNDITNGTNLGCGSEGFAAVKGWDPSSGLGTPNYPKMQKLFLALP